MRGWESGIHVLHLASQSNYLYLSMSTYIHFLDTTTHSALHMKVLTALLRNLKLFTYWPFYRACYPKSPLGDFFFFGKNKGECELKSVRYQLTPSRLGESETGREKNERERIWQVFKNQSMELLYKQLQVTYPKALKGETQIFVC